MDDRKVITENQKAIPKTIAYVENIHIEPLFVPSAD